MRRQSLQGSAERGGGDSYILGAGALPPRNPVVVVVLVRGIRNGNLRVQISTCATGVFLKNNTLILTVLTVHMSDYAVPT